MPFSSPTSYPRAILHIDGDAFFASCEQARNTAWRGKPVITGKERGIAASMSYEAKARGVTRAMRLFEIKKICPDAIILPSDYETYSLLSQRFYAIVRRFTPEVEEYGVDECFADITGLRRFYHCSYESIAEKIKATIDRELGFTFSVGLAPNKVLAKIGSKWKKPSGLTAIPINKARLFLQNLPVGKVWGIGPATVAFLEKYQRSTALDFAVSDEAWVRHYLSKPFLEIWQELNGAFVLPLNLEQKTDYASIQKTKTFTPPSRDPVFIFSQLSKNIENACGKARRYGLAASKVYVFVKTQDFNYQGLEVTLNQPTNIPLPIIKVVEDIFPQLVGVDTDPSQQLGLLSGKLDSFSTKRLYRATGIILTELKPAARQRDLFGVFIKAEKLSKIYEGVDAMAKKYGKHTIFVGTSWQAHQFGQHLNERGDEPERKRHLLLGENKRRRLGIPMWLGNVG